ncbi:cysteine sulfinate desulfinase [Alphaproteobacteria bacterium 46_93_T64]|nr:cysteine sulfinate desulfinase [Alphaproteobacteria bacterium 46_93_T64]
MRISETIYLDHQASTPVDSRVLSAMLPSYRESFANPHSSDHAFGWKSAAAIDEAGANVAAMIGSDIDEIIFTSGATEANNLALLGLARHKLNGKRNRIIVCSIEHKCVLEAARYLKDNLNYCIELAPVDNRGIVDLDYLRETISDDVLLLSIGVVNCEIGSIQPIEEISKITQEYGTILHCDAAQAPIALSLSDYANFVDMLSLSAHKFYGPKGIGALYIRRDLKNQIEPLIFGGGQQDGLRSGTLPTPLIIGMGAAAKILSLPEEVDRRNALKECRDKFVIRLKDKLNFISVNGPSTELRHPGNANICFKGLDARQLLAMMQPVLAASMGSACSSGVIEPSYVLRSTGLTYDEANASIRFSLGHDTTKEDITDAVTIILETLDKMRDSSTLMTA